MLVKLYLFYIFIFYYKHVVSNILLMEKLLVKISQFNFISVIIKFQHLFTCISPSVNSFHIYIFKTDLRHTELHQ